MSNLVRTSKYLSYILRHEPESIGLELDAGGWADVCELIARSRAEGRTLDRELLEEVVESGDKDRFSFSETGDRIRANYGHSIDVDLGLEPVEPPPTLLHGTAERHLDSIRREGLRSMGRQWVHLNGDTDRGRALAREVGGRHGTPVLLSVQTSKCQGPFYRTESGIWLVEHVRPNALEIRD